MSAFPYVFGLLMRTLHTTEMLISGAFLRATCQFRELPLSQAASGPWAGETGVPGSRCLWDLDHFGAARALRSAPASPGLWKLS